MEWLKCNINVGLSGLAFVHTEGKCGNVVSCVNTRVCKTHTVALFLGTR
jgi:hypothetical protein